LIFEDRAHFLMRFSAPETAWGQTVVFFLAQSQRALQQRLAIQWVSLLARMPKPEPIFGARACGF
jgi:hypothetical protein